MAMVCKKDEDALWSWVVMSSFRSGPHVGNWLLVEPSLPD
jgi:hypothetical protein